MSDSILLLYIDLSLILLFSFQLKRTLTLEGDTLHQVLFMETSNVTMTEHLRATYKKVE